MVETYYDTEARRLAREGRGPTASSSSEEDAKSDDGNLTLKATGLNITSFGTLAR